MDLSLIIHLFIFATLLLIVIFYPDFLAKFVALYLFLTLLKHEIAEETSWS